MKIHQGLISELQAKQPNNEPLSLTRTQQKQLKDKVDQLETLKKVDFSTLEEVQVQSPEDRQCKQH